MNMFNNPFFRSVSRTLTTVAACLALTNIAATSAFANCKCDKDCSAACAEGKTPETCDCKECNHKAGKKSSCKKCKHEKTKTEDKAAPAAAH